MHFLSLLPALTLSTFLHYSLNSAKSNIGYPFPYTLGPGFSTSQSCLFCPIDPRPYWSSAEAWAATKREWQKRQIIKGEGSCCSITEPTKHLRAPLEMCWFPSHAQTVKSTAGIESSHIPCAWAWTREDLARPAPCWSRGAQQVWMWASPADRQHLRHWAAHQREHSSWGAYSLSKHDREQQGGEKKHYSQSHPAKESRRIRRDHGRSKATWNIWFICDCNWLPGSWASSLSTPMPQFPLTPISRETADVAHYKTHPGSPQQQGKASKCTSVPASTLPQTSVSISCTLFGLTPDVSHSPSHHFYNRHLTAGEPGNPESYFHPCGKLRCWEFVYPPLPLKCLPS